jgi:hypothetical protein
MSYDIIIIPAVLIIAYIITYLSYRRNTIGKNFHNKAWNLILLISFIFTALIGTIQAGIIDFDINFSLIAALNYWHTEFGISFFVLIFFHLSMNWDSLKKLITNS